MSNKLWVLLIALMVFPVSCKEPAKASKKSPAAGNAVPQTTIQSERPESTEDTDVDHEEDDCKNSTSSHDDEDDEEDDDLGLRLTGKSGASELTGDVKKKSVKKKKSGKKKNSKKSSKKKSNKILVKPTVPNAVQAFGLLAADPTYDDDIKSILSDKCESCHASGDEYALDTYSKAKKIKTKIGEQVESGDMPPKSKSPLTSSEKSLVKKWIAAGALESAVEEDEEDEETDSHSDCDDDDDDDKKDDKNTTGADWDDLLKPKEVKKCTDKDKIFDRLQETCHKAKIASFACDKSGVVKAFKDLSINVESQYDDFISDGYKIDQCGEFGNEPVVLFYKKKEDKNELKLLIKKLCKKGSEACDN